MNETNQTSLQDVIAVGGRKQNPIHLNAFVMVTHLICCIIGIPVNGLIACAILYLKRLRSKPRNVFMLGLILSNFSSFVPVLSEFAYYHFPSDELCKFYVAVVGLPYVLFLTNMFLALIDRYVAVVYPMWHLKKITVTLAVVVQLIASLSISLLYKFVYVIGRSPLACEVPLRQVNVIAVSLMTLYFSCVVTQYIVYRQTRDILRGYRKGQTIANVSFSNKTPNLCTSKRASVQQQAGSPKECNPEHINQGEPVPLDVKQNDEQENGTTVKLNLSISNQTVDRLELEASRTVVAGVTSLTIMTGPFILFTLALLICRLFYENQVCSSIAWLAPYFKELVVIHAVYHPLMHLFRSSELSMALRELF